MKKRINPDLGDDLEESEDSGEVRPKEFIPSQGGALNSLNVADLVLLELNRSPSGFYRHRRFVLENFLRVFAPMVGMSVPEMAPLEEVRRRYARGLSKVKIIREAQLRTAEMSGEIRAVAFYEYDRLLVRASFDCMKQAISKGLIDKPVVTMGQGSMSISFEEGELGFRKPF